MEPGFRFLSSSRGCAPFQLEIQTSFFQSIDGTKYYVDWGDGTTQEYTQTGPGPDGPIISHTYQNAAQNCYYELTIEAENACNPRGSVPLEPIFVTVWTNDVLTIDPGEYRVCEGYAETLQFTDESDWNCFPHLTPSRENRAPRWIQWEYGTGNPATRIGGVRVDGILPGVFPYFDPDGNQNPEYPVLAPGDMSLPIEIPVTTAADVGKEFQVTLKNWNQCNAYDNNLLDGDRNPADLVNGDNPAQTRTARIVIVDSPDPEFLTRVGGSTGNIAAVFCAGDDIYFDNETPDIAGANFAYTWEFYGDATDDDPPIATLNTANPIFAYNSSGDKLIRLKVRDQNAIGNCESVVEHTINISPSLTAKISITDLNGSTIPPEFCQENETPFTTFDARFTDTSQGVLLPSTEFRWEFYDENNVLVLAEPAVGYSTNREPFFDRSFTTPGTYRVILKIRDNVTTCETVDEVTVRVFRKPVPDFTVEDACEGIQVHFEDASTLDAIGTESIVIREWDLDYDGVTFSKESAYDNLTSFDHLFTSPGTQRVALRVVTNGNNCESLIDKEIEIHPLPVSDFIVDATSGCSVLDVVVTNNSITQAATISEFIWEVDEGSGFVSRGIQRPTDPDFSNQFILELRNNGTANKDFDVRMRAVSNQGCEQVSIPQTITVFPSPPAGFISTNYSPFDDNCTPVSVNFSVDQVTQGFNPTEYVWTVMDGTTQVSQVSTGTTPAYSHDFINSSQAIKDFSIGLEARLTTGCFGDSVRTIRISPAPSSNFSREVVEYDCERIVVHLEAEQKGLQEYQWTILSNSIILFQSSLEGDSFDYEINRSNSVSQAIEIRLTTLNFANCESQQTTQSFTLPQTDLLNAAFTSSPSNQKFPAATVNITNASLPGPWSYEWDFGDGNTSTTSATSFIHTYETFGTFTIKLTVSNGDCIKTASSTVTIDPPTPILDFTYNPSSGCSPLTVTFTNTSQYADPSSYQWQFGDDEGVSNAINPTYTYYQTGLYTVTLSANNGFGETAQISKQFIIEVLEQPSALFQSKPSQVQFPGGTLYLDNQSLGAISYLWDFGDGNTSNQYEPTHVYTTEGVFDISLTVTNEVGCSDTHIVEAAVETIRGGRVLVPNAFTPSTTGPGDSGGKNDVFRPMVRGVIEYHLFIFNRWGQLMFETTDPLKGWDGYYNGKLCQQDVYVYRITGRYSDGQLINQVGDVTLIR